MTFGLYPRRLAWACTCMLPASGTCALNGQGIGAKLVGAALALNPQTEPDLKQGVLL